MSKYRTLATILVFFASLFLLSIPAMANSGNGNNGFHSNGKNGHPDSHGSVKNNPNKGKKDKTNKDELVSVNLSYDQARALAINYGLTGHRPLPPGIAKNLARGKSLPPGIAKKAVPVSMLSHLPTYKGYEWSIVGNNLVLVAVSTAIVASVINGVFN